MNLHEDTLINVLGDEFDSLCNVMRNTTRYISISLLAVHEVLILRPLVMVPWTADPLGERREIHLNTSNPFKPTGGGAVNLRQSIVI